MPASSECLLNPAAAATVSGLTALALRVAYVVKSIRCDDESNCPRQQQSSKRKKRTRPVSTLVVLGSGGHTTEMIRLLTFLDARKYSPLTYVVAKTDTTSLQWIEASTSARRGDEVFRIPRSREVGQSYFTSILTTLQSFWSCVYVALRARPDFVLCNGPGTCLPIVVLVFILRILGLAGGNVIFVESFCRVKHLSLTGRLIYPIVDKFIVHWPELREQYPRSELVSSFVSHPGESEDTTTRSHGEMN
jgi:beta-1,4-N-acetylglucosaminyltransferase